MKDEVFVNFLGYREPNLQYVMRCKGLCGLADRWLQDFNWKFDPNKGSKI